MANWSEVQLFPKWKYFKKMNGRELLNHAGKISHEKGLEKSAHEYSKFRETQNQLEYEESFKELERDIKDLKKQSVK